MSFNRIKVFFVELLKKDLFRASSMMALSSGITALSRFLLVIILARYFTSETYGVWVSITSVAAIMMFGDLGITNALRNKLSFLRSSTHDTNNEQREYFYSAFYSFLAIAILLVFLFLALAPFLPIDRLYNTDDLLLKEQGIYIFTYIQIVFLLSIPFGIAMGLFFSYDESRYVAYLNIISSVAILSIVLVLAFVFKVDIVTLAQVYFALTLLFNLVALVLFIVKRKWHSNFLVPLSLVPGRFKELLNTGLLFLGIQLSTAYVSNVPTVFIGATCDLSTAASFNIIQKLYFLVITVYQSVFNPVWAKLSLLSEAGDWQAVKKMHGRVVVLSGGVLILATCFLSFFAQPIINLVAGNQYEVSTSIVFLLGLCFFFYIIFEAASILQNALGKLKLRMISQIVIIAFINLLFSYSFELFQIRGIIFSLILVWLLLFLLMFTQGRLYIKSKLK